jgi:hypothetical protein
MGGIGWLRVYSTQHGASVTAGATKGVCPAFLAFLKSWGPDLISADGRADISALLSEIERLSPGADLQQAARIELRALGWGAIASSIPSLHERGPGIRSVDICA